MENNPSYYYKTKNIDVQYHFMRDMVESQHGDSRESRHVGKHNRLFEKVCECCEVLLVQRCNGNCFLGFVNEI
jgi:hypothetical protein